MEPSGRTEGWELSRIAPCLRKRGAQTRSDAEAYKALHCSWPGLSAGSGGKRQKLCLSADLRGIFPRQRQQRVWGPLFGLVSLRDSMNAQHAVLVVIASRVPKPLLFLRKACGRANRYRFACRAIPLSDKGEAVA